MASRVIKLRDPERQIYYNMLDPSNKLIFLKTLALPKRFGAEIYVSDRAERGIMNAFDEFAITTRDKNDTIVYRTMSIKTRPVDDQLWISDSQLQEIANWIKKMNLQEEP